MLQRTPLFPHVIELNHQARRRVGCSVYLIYDESEWALIDIGYEDSADDFIELSELAPLIARNPSERMPRPAVANGDMGDEVESEHLMRSA